MDMVRRFVMPGTVGLLVLVSSIASATNLPAYCRTARWQPFIDEAASRFALSAQWLYAVIGAESAGCESMDGRPTTSAAGAMGLMQLLPTTWERLRSRLNLGIDPYNPHDNILAGAAYLRELYDRYGWPGASAAYHAGPGRYDDYLKSGRPLAHATLDYLARIDRAMARMSAELLMPGMPAATSSPADRHLFLDRKSSAETTDQHSDQPSNDGLFVALRHARRHAEHKVTEQK